MLGMIFAVRGLLRVRAHFGQPPLRRLCLEWFKRFPKWKKGVSIGVGAGTVGVAGLKARLEIWTPDKKNQPVEKRIEGIILNVNRLREAQAKQEEFIDKLRESIESYQKKVAEDAKVMEGKLRSDLESLHTSDLITSLVGLVWLTVGISMSTMSKEICKWAQCIGGV
jgi:hypothetical protein